MCRLSKFLFVWLTKGLWTCHWGLLKQNSGDLCNYYCRTVQIGWSRHLQWGNQRRLRKKVACYRRESSCRSSHLWTLKYRWSWFRWACSNNICVHPDLKSHKKYFSLHLWTRAWCRHDKYRLTVNCGDVDVSLIVKLKLAVWYVGAKLPSILNLTASGPSVVLSSEAKSSSIFPLYPLATRY